MYFSTLSFYYINTNKYGCISLPCRSVLNTNKYGCISLPCRSVTSTLISMGVFLYQPNVWVYFSTLRSSTLISMGVFLYPVVLYINTNKYGCISLPCRSVTSTLISMGVFLYPMFFINTNKYGCISLPCRSLHQH